MHTSPPDSDDTSVHETTYAESINSALSRSQTQASEAHILACSNSDN